MAWFGGELAKHSPIGGFVNGFCGPTTLLAEETLSAGEPPHAEGVMPMPITRADAMKRMNKKTYFAYRSFKAEHETMQRFAAVGVDTFCIFPSSTDNSLGKPYSDYPPIWRYADQYDFTSLDRQFDEILAIVPNARFLCMIDLNTPGWLARQLGMQMDGGFDSFIELSNTLSNERWKTLTRQYLEAFLRHTEARYGDRIDAYILACGQTDEWMDYASGRFSRAKWQKFNVWNAAHGFAPLSQPIPFAQRDTATFEGWIRSPLTEAALIHEAQFTGELIVDTIVEFARQTKSLCTTPKEVGVFYGYILELTGQRLVSCGHLEYERLMQSGAIDFFISPGTYSERPIGGGSGFMIPAGTRLQYGINQIHEIDHRTTTYNIHLDEYVSLPFEKWKSTAEDIAGTRREMSLALINHTSLWWFDMWGGAHSTDTAIENMAKMKAIWDAKSTDFSPSVAQIALIVDPQSARFLNDRHANTNGVFHAMRNRLNHLGMPFDLYSFNDLETLDLSPYRLLVLPGSFLIDAEREKILRDKVMRDGRTILWVYAPGVLDGVSEPNAQRVEKYTGVPYGTPGMSVIEMQGDTPIAPTDSTQSTAILCTNTWRSVYFHTYAEITSELLQKIARDAGVWSYIDDPVPVYANERLLAIHMARGGEKTIRLPRRCSRVTELFSGKTVAEQTDTFTYTFETPETALFELFSEVP